MADTNKSSIVTKCATMIDLLARSRRPLKLTDIVERSGLVKSSAHRILSILLSEDMAEFEKSTKTYKLGPRFTVWARAAWRRTDLEQIAASELEALSEKTNMNATLSIRDGNSILYLSTYDTVPVRYAAPAGERAPLYCTAAGKIILAFMQEDRLSSVLDELKYERFTEFTIRDTNTLVKELEMIRKQGYSLSIKEEFFQVMGIAAPVWNASDELAASISLWTLTERTTEQDVESLSDLIMTTAQQISNKLKTESI